MFHRAISSVGLERALDKGEVDGSSPSWPYDFCFGGIAQLVERCFCTAEVSGSIPLISKLFIVIVILVKYL